MNNRDDDLYLTRRERDEFLRDINATVKLNNMNILNILDALDKLVKSTIEQQYLMNHGIEGFKDMVLDSFKKQSKEARINRLHALFMHDRELTHPHKKILAFLLNLYDYQNGLFRQAYFSKIVKECKLGKNKAKDYLELIVKKGYIKKKDDGYRVWYCISDWLLSEKK